MRGGKLRHCRPASGEAALVFHEELFPVSRTMGKLAPSQLFLYFPGAAVPDVGKAGN
jgi:hypothetical protein